MTRTKKMTIRRTSWQKLTILIAALAMVISIGILTGLSIEPSYAESYTITGQYATSDSAHYTGDWPDGVTSVPSDLETTFSLYKVGYYTHDENGNSVITLNEEFADITLPEKDKEDDSSEWVRRIRMRSMTQSGGDRSRC